MNLRPATEDDREPMLALVRQSFNQPPAMVERMRSLPIDDFWVAEERGALLAAAARRSFGHFFGGASIPTAGISSVVVAPHARGRRLAESLVGRLLLEVRSSCPLSSLYPATVPLYRRLGYEFAALHVTYRLPIAAVPRYPDEAQVEPWTDDDLADVVAAQRSYAERYNATMDRADSYWRLRILGPMGEQPVYRVLVREDGRVTGSMIYTQENDFHMDLQARDLFWLTPVAGRALLTFISRYHSLGKDLVWNAAPVNPISFFAGEDRLKTESRWHLMLRLLDVPEAIRARRYASGRAAAVTFAVDDPLVPANRGPWRVVVAEGKAVVEPASEAELTVPAGALASVYSGMLDPFEARRLALLDGPGEALGRLGAIFAGPMPWITEFF